MVLVIILVFSACEKEENTCTVKDIDGNCYKTVRIGSQVWFAENLRTTRFADGTQIPLITDDDEFKWCTESARCMYNNMEVYYDIFGMMYNWYAATDTCSLCPDGWHVPSDEEWKILVDYLGGVDIAGGKMKAVDTVLWNSPNVGATNESGLSVLPGGFRNENGRFGGKGSLGIFWSTTVYNYNAGRILVTQANNSKAVRDFSPNMHGFYVRCLKDE